MGGRLRLQTIPAGLHLLWLGHAGGTAPALTPVLYAAPSLMLSPALLPLLLTFRLLLSTAVGFSQDHPCGSLSTWPRGGLKCPGLGLTCVGHPFRHLAFLGWCGSLVLGSLWACGVQSSR